MTARLCFTAAHPSLTGKLLARRIVTSTASTSTDWQPSKRTKPVEGLPLSSPLSSQRRVARPTVVHEQAALPAVALPEWPGLQDQAFAAEEQTPGVVTLAWCAKQVLLTADPKKKAALSHQAWRRFKAGLMPVGQTEPPERPARPSKPQLVPAKKVPTPKQSPLPLPVYMLHNLAHVELNAIDLAWDTVARFSGLQMDQGFYSDFARVADDESRHLSWCLQRLDELGYAYGDMVAHSILWDGAQASSGDLAGRLAVVPMSQEAKGLDAGPRLAEKLVGCGDNRSAAIVSRMLLKRRLMLLSVSAGLLSCQQHWERTLGPPISAASPLWGSRRASGRRTIMPRAKRYDRSLWPADGVAAKHNVIPSSASQVEGLQTYPDTPALGKDSMMHLRQRMATVLDVELCNAA